MGDPQAASYTESKCIFLGMQSLLLRSVPCAVFSGALRSARASRNPRPFAPLLFGIQVQRKFGVKVCECFYRFSVFFLQVRLYWTCPVDLSRALETSAGQLGAIVLNIAMPVNYLVRVSGNLEPVPP